jgi:hypothetical protein
VSEEAHPPPAGWYPDPSASTLLRYWDGGAWTADTAPRWLPPQAQGKAETLLPEAPVASAGVAEWWGCQLCSRTFTSHSAADRHARAEHPEVSQIEALGALRRLAASASLAPPAAGPRSPRIGPLGYLMLVLATLASGALGFTVGSRVSPDIPADTFPRPAQQCARDGGKYRDGFCEFSSRAPRRGRTDGGA